MIVDLFAGPGGWSEGLRLLGFWPVTEQTDLYGGGAQGDRTPHQASKGHGGHQDVPREGVPPDRGEVEPLVRPMPAKGSGGSTPPHDESSGWPSSAAAGWARASFFWAPPTRTVPLRRLPVISVPESLRSTHRMPS